MTQETKRIKIAEACGWQRHYNTDMQWRYDGDGPDDWIVEDELPDYFHDLNAMHEAEKTLTDEQKGEYINQLSSICGDTMWFIHATAAQRAEAFGRVKGLWE